MPLTLPLFLGLGLTDLHNDEAIYAYAVDSILETGDWLTPLASPTGLPFLEKPPLNFWIVAGAIRLGLVPHDERGMRFMDALFGALAMLYVFWIGARLIDPVAGLAAVFLLFIQPALLFAEHSLRSCGMESMLFLQFSGSIYHALAWAGSRSAARRTVHVMAIAGWLAFGVLAKPTALLVPLTLAAMLAVPGWRQRLWRDRWRWFAGATLAAALIAPWFVAQTLLRGADFWRQLVGQQLLERAVRGLDPDHLQPWYWYGSFVVEQLQASHALPWVVLGAGLLIVRVSRRGWAGGALVLLWIALPLGVMSISVSKLGHYIFPSLPALALFGGLALSLLAQLGEESARRLAGSRLAVAVRERAAKVIAGAPAARAPAAGAPWTWLFAGLAGLAFAVAAVRAAAGSGGLALAVPWATGCACLALVPTRRRGFVLAAILGTLTLWPLSLYDDVLDRLATRSSPLRAVQQCVDRLGPAVIVGEGRRGSMLYVHIPKHEPLAHPYFYYFRHLDVWQRPWRRDEGLLYFRLFVRGHQAPTVIDRGNYLAFIERAAGEDVQRAARDLMGQVRDLAPDSELPDAQALERPPALALLGPTIMLLPGPYAVCQEPALAAGGRRFVVDQSPSPGRRTPGRPARGCPPAPGRRRAR